MLQRKHQHANDRVSRSLISRITVQNRDHFLLKAGGQFECVRKGLSHGCLTTRSPKGARAMVFCPIFVLLASETSIAKSGRFAAESVAGFRASGQTPDERFVKNTERWIGHGLSAIEPCPEKDWRWQRRGRNELSHIMPVFTACPKTKKPTSKSGLSH